MPRLPEEDDDPIEIDEKYAPALKECLQWKAAERMGKFSPSELKVLEQMYLDTASKYTGDIYRPPVTALQNLWKNQRGRGAAARGVKDQGSSGVKWSLNH